jgi:hypothetical protein
LLQCAATTAYCACRLQRILQAARRASCKQCVLMCTAQCCMASTSPPGKSIKYYAALRCITQLRVVFQHCYAQDCTPRSRSSASACGKAIPASMSCKQCALMRTALCCKESTSPSLRAAYCRCWQA